MKAPLCAAVALACVACTGPRTPGAADRAGRDLHGGWLTAGWVPLIRESGERRSGAAAMAMVAAHFGLSESAGEVLREVQPARTREAVLTAMRDWAWDRGLRAVAIRGQLADLERELGRHRPVVVRLAQRAAPAHYEVVVALHPGRRIVATLDPTAGVRVRSLDDMERAWSAAGHAALLVLPPGTDLTAGLSRELRDGARQLAACAAPGNSPLAISTGTR